ncbi:DUF1648 domain-containing protein [Microbacterium capsulatum]|uniref:DUF1648 domain-containing protein n=1 Tax=Microbacterium capsulatum TaxID=3041921 RepID=A0ABU0XJQ0_9MICO|nr:DUF1648 domain-containing protein [Microbacterium sp. ASV81]MDQ4215364.1 DUF1648 domain-containing protein [Microbacterium sp. ASV81]
MMDRTGSAGRNVTAIPAADLRRARVISLLIGVVIPLVLSGVVLGIILGWLPELPAPAVTHWGPTGADRFGPPATFAWAAVLLGFVLPAILTIATVAVVRDNWGGAARLLGGMALGLSGLSAVVNLAAVGTQRGLSDAKQAPDLWPYMLIGAALFLVLIAVGWLVQPHIRPAPAAPLQPVHVTSIARGERVAWLATATMSRVALILIALVMVLVVALTAVMAMRFTDRLWVPVVTLVLVGVALATAVSFRVRIDQDGLSVRSQVGFPRVHVPLDEIVAVRAVDCNPFGEFGGFGWRLGLDGRTGIVLRTGPAIEVERRDKRALVVTVDGADIAVAVLRAYLDRGSASSAAAEEAGS